MANLPLVLSIIGAVLFVAIEQLIDQVDAGQLSENLIIAVASGLGAAFTALSLTLKPGRWVRNAVFSVFAGAVVAALIYFQLHLDRMSGYSFSTLLIALGLALPLYQATAPHSSSLYSALHRHAWTNVLVFLLSALFVALAFACAWLLAHLFALIEIDLLKDWLQNTTFSAALAGAAAGGAAGVLRSNRRVVASTQGVVQSVLSLLAVPLGIGLPLFLVTLLTTGLTPLWEARWSATVAVLSAAALAVVLANSVVRDDDEAMGDNRFYRFAARLLCLCVLPLTAIAFYALNLRIDDFGLTPERIWGGIAISVAMLYGILYLIAAVPSETWASHVRNGNVALAILVCALALILATPLVDIGALAARQQLSRLDNGTLPVKKFDAAALAHDFGPGGRAALEAHDTANNPVLAERIATALRDDGETELATADLRAELVVQPADTPLPDALVDTLTRVNVCGGTYCHAFVTDTHALILHNRCYNSNRGGCLPSSDLFAREDSGVWSVSYGDTAPNLREQLDSLDALVARGDISIRRVERVQLFIGDTPISRDFAVDAFDDWLE